MSLWESHNFKDFRDEAARQYRNARRDMTRYFYEKSKKKDTDKQPTTSSDTQPEAKNPPKQLGKLKKDVPIRPHEYLSEEGRKALINLPKGIIDNYKAPTDDAMRQLESEIERYKSAIKELNKVKSWRDKMLRKLGGVCSSDMSEAAKGRLEEINKSIKQAEDSLRVNKSLLKLRFLVSEKEKLVKNIKYLDNIIEDVNAYKNQNANQNKKELIKANNLINYFNRKKNKSDTRVKVINKMLKETDLKQVKKESITQEINIIQIPNKEENITIAANQGKVIQMWEKDEETGEEIRKWTEEAVDRANKENEEITIQQAINTSTTILSGEFTDQDLVDEPEDLKELPETGDEKASGTNGHTDSGFASKPGTKSGTDEIESPPTTSSLESKEQIEQKRKLDKMIETAQTNFDKMNKDCGSLEKDIASLFDSSAKSYSFNVSEDYLLELQQCQDSLSKVFQEFHVSLKEAYDDLKKVKSESHAYTATQLSQSSESFATREKELSRQYENIKTRVEIEKAMQANNQILDDINEYQSYIGDILSEIRQEQEQEKGYKKDYDANKVNYFRCVQELIKDEKVYKSKKVTNDKKNNEDLINHLEALNKKKDDFNNKFTKLKEFVEARPEIKKEFITEESAMEKGRRVREKCKGMQPKDTSDEFKEYENKISYLGSGIFSIETDHSEYGTYTTDIYIKDGKIRPMDADRKKGLYHADILWEQKELLLSELKGDEPVKMSQEDWQMAMQDDIKKDIDNFELREVWAENVKNWRTRRTMKLFLPSDFFLSSSSQQSFTFTKDSKGYIGMLGTPNCYGKAYLLAQRSPKLEITAIEFIKAESTIAIRFHIGKKPEDVSTSEIAVLTKSQGLNVDE